MQLISTELPALALLVLGLALAVLEMYLPGFGAPGVLGGLCLVAGIVMLGDDPMEALIATMSMVALLGVALSLSIRSLASGRLAKSKLVLNEAPTALSEQDLSYFVGHRGVASTVLRPAGIGEFEGVKLNVVSDGEFIESGTKVRIERVEGNRIVVRQVK